VADGADEVDMVINRGAFLAGEFSRVQDEIAGGRRGLRDAALKVILEVSELETYDASGWPRSWRCGSCGGRLHQDEHGQDHAQRHLGNNQVMIEAIRDFYLDTGIAIGMKPAGGIRRPSRRSSS
jgi:deoxyribose-phosphate aldolase